MRAPDEPVTCEALADFLRQQLPWQHVEVRCSPDNRAVDVEVVDPSITSDEAAAERIAHIVWDRAGLALNLQSIMVTMSPHPLADTDVAETFAFGRSLLFLWGLQQLDAHDNPNRSTA